PYSGELVDAVALASWANVDDALSIATHAFERTKKQSASERSRVLFAAADGIRRRRDEFIDLIVAEGGKPRKNTVAEVDRAVSTMTWAAEEAKRFTGELQRLDTEPTAPGRLGIVRHFPLGVVFGIAPFNFPLNLVCHKV